MSSVPSIVPFLELPGEPFQRSVAMVYDVDYTLMDGYHPNLVFEKRGIDPEPFWQGVREREDIESRRRDAVSLDSIWIAHFLHEVRHGSLSGLTLAELRECGTKMQPHLYEGLPQFFEEIKQQNPTFRISNNLVSVGLRPLLEASPLGIYADRIFGYRFIDDLTPGPILDELLSTSSALEKIPAVVSISTGAATNGYEFPIRDMIYFGDGMTDVPAFRFIKKRGGTVLCVYDSQVVGARDRAQFLANEVTAIVPADYRRGSELWQKVQEHFAARQ